MIHPTPRSLAFTVVLCGLAAFTAFPSPSAADTRPRPASAPVHAMQKRPSPGEAKRMRKELDRIRAEFNKNRKKDAPKRLISAEYSAFRTLAAIVRMLDKSKSFTADIDAEVRNFETEDRERPADAGKIANGMSGMYSMYGLLYRMRFENDPDRLRTLEQMNDSVIARFAPGRPAIDALAVISENMYRIAKDMLRNIDLREAYTAEFNAVEEQYINGVGRAESPEDRFLNGIYRTFELSQIWAMFLEPTTRKEIVELNREMIKDNEKITTIESQLALGMEYLYRILDVVARQTVDVMY